jgi:hypothetical protein
VHQVVLEADLTRHRTGERQQLGLGIEILGQPPLVENAVVPVVAPDELSELVGVPREGREDGAQAARLIDPERFPVATAAQLVILSAAQEAVVKRIEREQHPDPAVGLGMQHEEVAIGFGTRVHAHPVALVHVPLLVEPHLHHRILRRCGVLSSGGRGERKRGE